MVEKREVINQKLNKKKGRKAGLFQLREYKKREERKEGNPLGMAQLSDKKDNPGDPPLVLVQKYLQENRVEKFSSIKS